MSQAGRLKMLVIVGVLASAGCSPQAKPLVLAEPPSGPWPPQLVGRQLWAETDRYALYANDRGQAVALSEWLDAELTALCSEMDAGVQGKGLVLAIESGEDPVRAIGQWHDAHVDRSRLIAWTSPIRRQWVVSSAGRPYCLGRKPYFRESFAMPCEDAVRVGILDGQGPCPDWICFLTTDCYFRAAYDAERWEARWSATKSLGDVPTAVVLLSLPALPLMYAMGEFILASYRSIDLELMQLQRREVLRAAVLPGWFPQEPQRSERLAALRDQTDAKWKYIWVRRPID